MISPATEDAEPQLMTRKQHKRWRDDREMEHYEALGDLYDAAEKKKSAEEAAEKAARNKPANGQISKVNAIGITLLKWVTFYSNGGKLKFWATCYDDAVELVRLFVGERANAFLCCAEDDK